MANLLAKGMAWLHEKSHAELTSEVVYHRGPRSRMLLATVGEALFETSDNDGLPIQYQTRDYLIRPGDLAFFGLDIEPRIGDRIAEVVGAKRFIYEVLEQGGQKAWVWSDRQHNRMRVHTKHIATEAA